MSTDKCADKCAYTVLIKTGTLEDASTDANVSLKLAGPDRRDPEFLIKNLKSWGGAMETGRHYFQGGQMDVFKGMGPSLPKPPCWMCLSHDNTSNRPGWYVEYVEVFTFSTGPDQCWFQHFDVNQWLCVGDTYQLFAEKYNSNK